MPLCTLAEAHQSVLALSHALEWNCLLESALRAQMSNSVAVALSCTAMQCVFQSNKHMLSLCPLHWLQFGSPGWQVARSGCSAELHGHAVRLVGALHKHRVGRGRARARAAVAAAGGLQLGLLACTADTLCVSTRSASACQELTSTSQHCLPAHQAWYGTGALVCGMTNDHAGVGESDLSPAAVSWAHRRR